jgi:hypothetical protein
LLGVSDKSILHGSVIFLSCVVLFDLFISDHYLCELQMVFLIILDLVHKLESFI